MYKYTCKVCGYIEYGSIEISETRCNECNSLAFGLKKKEWVKNDNEEG